MSRRSGRYERRKAKREANRLQRSLDVGGLSEVFTYHDLYSAGKQCCNAVRWKNSTQRFELHLFSGTARRRQLILEHRWEPAAYVHFMISERGKTRPIDAPRIQDRQIHKVFTQKVLLPLYLPSMIWNNGASLPGKGFEFSKRELREDLRYHFRRYGREGSVILLDFKQFFPSVSHEMIFRRHKQLLHNNDLRALGDSIVNTVPGGKGLPLGVEPSQAEMIAFPSALDNYIKCQLSIQCAGHYMDDYYVIVPPDRDAKEIMNLVVEKAESLRLTISRSKSRIVPLTKPFRYCKANRLAIYIMLFLAIGLAGGFYLALKSITTGYTGALMCWTVVFTPIGTACSIVLSKIVHKSEVENSSAQGEGIKYAMAKANNFSTNSSEMSSIDSPPI